jgi:hypothetical protein
MRLNSITVRWIIFWENNRELLCDYGKRAKLAVLSFMNSYGGGVAPVLDDFHQPS